MCPSTHNYIVRCLKLIWDDSIFTHLLLSLPDCHSYRIRPLCHRSVFWSHSLTRWPPEGSLCFSLLRRFLRRLVRRGWVGLPGAAAGGWRVRGFEFLARPAVGHHLFYGANVFLVLIGYCKEKSNTFENINVALNILCSPLHLTNIGSHIEL